MNEQAMQHIKDVLHTEVTTISESIGRIAEAAFKTQGRYTLSRSDVISLLETILDQRGPLAEANLLCQPADLWDELVDAVTYRMDTVAREDAAAEAEAKARWEAFQPTEGTIEWYDKWFADTTVDNGPRTSEYRSRWEYIKEWNQERADFGDDDGWLSVMQENYQMELDQIAEFDLILAEEKAKGTRHEGTAHVIGASFSGCYDA